MKRKLYALVLTAVMMGSVFTACSKPAEPAAPAEGDPAANTEAPAVAGEKVELKMSVTTADTSTWTQGANKFAELVSEKTGGNVTVRVFPNEQLSGGNQSKGVEQLMNGATDISLHSNIIYSVMDEKFGVISLPWLFPNYEAVDASLKGEGGKAVNALLDEKGVVGLGFAENGWRQLTNNVKPVNTVADMKGLKIRIPGMKMYTELYKSIGANPTAMNFSEVFTALQQGTIDGQENPLDVIQSSKLEEVQKYLTMWDYSYDALILGINKEKFASLSPEYQAALQEAATEACTFQVELNRSKVEEQIKYFEEKSIEVNYVSDENKAEFRKAVQPVYDMYEPIMTKELIDSFIVK